MNKTYHDFLEVAYFGNYKVRDPRTGQYTKRGIPYRNDRDGLASLTAKPSYHFGELLDVTTLVEPQYDTSSHADTEEADALFEKVNDHLDALGVDNVALVFDTSPDGETYIILTAFEFYNSNFMVARWRPNEGWVMVDGEAITRTANCYMRLIEGALALLVHPQVQYVMRDASRAMSTMSKNCERRGEDPVADMQIVHLTKRIYINGRPVGGERGTHASPKPHDRKGHYRTRATPAPGWDGPFIPVSGEFKGMPRYRRWFDETTVMGGAPKQEPSHGRATQLNAPQFRVVM